MDSPKRRDTETEAPSDDLTKSLDEFLAAVKDPIGFGQPFSVQHGQRTVEKPEPVVERHGRRRDRGLFWLAVFVIYLLGVVGLVITLAYIMLLS